MPAEWRRRPCGVSLRRLLLVGLVGLALFTLGGASLLAAGSVKRIEVPVFQNRLRNGDIRFVVGVRVGGGAQIRAMLDTGSFGLRVLARAVQPTQFETIGITRKYGYGRGEMLRGRLARAIVTIGDATTGTPIGIQIVESVTCNDKMPGCPASGLPPSDYGIGGDWLPGEGFDAILGLSLHGSDLPGAAINPLSAIGGQRWIIILPAPGAIMPGKLIINPNDGDLAGFNPIRLVSQPPRADGRTEVAIKVPSCPDSPLEQQPACPTMMLYSGARQGLQPFYSHEILFDAAKGTIAMKPR